MLTRQFGSSALSNAEKDALIRCVAAHIVKQEIPEIKPDVVTLNGTCSCRAGAPTHLELELEASVGRNIDLKSRKRSCPWLPILSRT